MSETSGVSIYAALRRRGHHESPQDAEGEASGRLAMERLRTADAAAMAAFWAEAEADVVPPHVVLEWVEECDAPPEATAAVSRRLADHPPPGLDFYFLYNLGRALRVDLGEPERAAGLLEQAVVVVASDGDAWLELGNARRDAGLDAPALEAWHAGLAAAPEKLVLWRNIGHHHKRHGRWEAAVSAMEACAAASGKAEDYHVLGHFLQEAGEGEAGAAALRQAVAGYAGRDARPTTRFWQAAALARLGDATAALATLAEAVRAEPSLAAEAATEEDFASLRGTAAWRAALEVSPDGC